MFSHVWRSFFDLLYPVRCVGCKTEGAWLCNTCATTIKLNETQYCPHCWQPSLGGRTCGNCKSKTPLDGLRVAASYVENPPLATAIRTLKYHFSTALADVLGGLLAKIVHANEYNHTRIVTYVPLHATRQTARGFNQAELLATAVGKALQLPVVPLLIRTRATRQQAKLSRVERLRNLDDAFALATTNTEINGITIILVDDVASTGTTLSECARVLKNAGAAEVWGCVVARG